MSSLGSAVAARIERAFSEGQGAGLIHLATVEMKTALPPALVHWKKVEKDARAGGLSFYEGMRPLAGAADSGRALAELPQPLREWSGIAPGEWLRELLSRLWHPEAERELTYGMVARSAALRERRWRLVVLDEAQAIKNPGAQQTRAVKQIAAASRIALTGTPIENRLADLWSLFDFLNPGLLGDARTFASAAKRLANAQHSFFQLLHQGTPRAALDFLLPARSCCGNQPQQDLAIASCLAQAEAYMNGQSAEMVRADLTQQQLPKGGSRS